MKTLNDGHHDDGDEETKSFSFDYEGKKYEGQATGRKLPFDTEFRYSISVNGTFLEDEEMNGITAPGTDNYIWEGGKDLSQEIIDKIGEQLEKLFI